MNLFSKALSVLAISSFLILGSGCQSQPVVESYYVNESGELIAVYDNGSETNLGEVSLDTGYFGSQVETIEINEDGYYVINGITTTISAVDVFTVSFLTNSNTTIEPQRIKDGYPVIKPTDPEKTGYSFEGWYFNDEKWVFNSNIVRSDMTLEANWNANQYHISFNSNGGTSFDPVTVTFDEEVSLPTPTKNLYTFVGWFYNDSHIQSGKWALALDIQLDARWVRTSYLITFDSAGGSSVPAISVPSFSIVNSLPIPTRFEHVFLGWFHNDNLVETPFEFTEGNMTFVARWKGLTESFEFSLSNSAATITKYIGTDSIVNVPSTIGGGYPVTTIGSEAFINNNSITSITFPLSAVNFEFKAIFQCNNLQEMTLSGSANITLKYLFGNDLALVPTSLKTIRFAEGSSTYSGEIFDGLSGSFLYTIYLPASLKTTPVDAFYQCPNIWKCFVPEGITALGSRTFCSCDNLVYLDLPSTLVSIGMNCIINNGSLKYLIIPASVTSVGHAGLAAVESVILFEATSTTLSSSVFSIYEDEMAIFYGFQQIKETTSFIYALCQVGSVKQAIIISLLDGATAPSTYPTELDGYPVTYNHIV